MATHKSAEKRARQNEVHRLRNRAVLSTVKSAVKRVREAIEKHQVADLDGLLKEAQATLAIAKRKGVIHRNNMARRIGRLALAVNKEKAVPQK